MKLKLFLLFALASSACLANNSTDITCESLADGIFKNVCIEIPSYRPIRGGTKIRISYSKDCPEELIGAFNYATKIWEENLPSMLPLNINVKWERIRGNGATNILSKVTYKTLESETTFDKDYLSPMAQIKYIVLKELHIQTSRRYTDIVEDVADCLDAADMTITYNSALYDEFSFHLDDVVKNKYDFVSLVLRDIAKGLGIGINITASNNSLVLPNSKKTFYESRIWNALEGETGSSAYKKCTQGSFRVPSLPLLYAPNPWHNGVSLQYYIPEETDALSKLLSYDFGKGYVMRDLSNIDWEDIKYILDWNEMVTVGDATGSASETGTTEQKLPYHGIINLSKVFGLNSQFSGKFDSKIDQRQTAALIDPDLSYDKLCDPYKLFYTGDKNVRYGYSISVLLSDGTWDVIYADYYPESLTINIEDLKLNYPDSSYARSCSGGLRYRLTKCEVQSYSQKPKYYVKYFTRDYLPQRANIKYSKLHYEAENFSSNNIKVSDDDYFVDVEIGLSNIEGTTKIIVEQLDEGERVPFRYEVDDFEQGYFIANLDRELSTQLTIYCYNENGMTKSNTIVVPAIGYQNSLQSVCFSRNASTIKTTGIESANLHVAYTLTNIINSQNCITGILPDCREIDIRDLPSGFYVLTLQVGQEKFTYKFTK